MKAFKTCLGLLLAVCMFACVFSACGKAAEPVTLAVTEISKYGNVKLDTTFDDLKACNIEVGDIITATVLGVSYDMPVGTSFSDVDSGDMVCRFDTDDNEVALAINSGSFATETGAADKETISEDPGYKWTLNTETVTLVLKEKQGYADEYKVRNLVRTDERSDYADLTDEAFANFRAVQATGIGAGVLYRSCTPVEPALGRNTYAAAAVEAAGVKTILNLDDSVEDMQEYETFPGSYYSTCAILNPEMGYNFTSAEFAEKVKQCVLFINENEGPYLIHCKEGKDRTGVVCAVLECFAGATYDEAEADYMQTYLNYYHLTTTDETYSLALQTTFVKNLSGILGVEDLKTADLQAKATEYLKAAGLTDADLATLSQRLAGGQ